MSWKTRKRGTPRQVGKKFPVEGKRGGYEKPSMKVSKVPMRRLGQYNVRIIAVGGKVPRGEELEVIAFDEDQASDMVVNWLNKNVPDTEFDVADVDFVGDVEYRKAQILDSRRKAGIVKGIAKEIL